MTEPEGSADETQIEVEVNLPAPLPNDHEESLQTDSADLSEMENEQMQRTNNLQSSADRQSKDTKGSEISRQTGTFT